MDRRELLRNVSLFSFLDERELDRLIQATTTRRLASKEVLFRKGDPGNQLFGILTGSLKVTGVGSDGKDVVFRLMGPGEVLGRDRAARQRAPLRDRRRRRGHDARDTPSPGLRSLSRATSARGDRARDGAGRAGAAALGAGRGPSDDVSSRPLREATARPRGGARRAPGRRWSRRDPPAATGSRGSRRHDPRERQQTSPDLGRGGHRRPRPRPRRSSSSRSSSRRSPTRRPSEPPSFEARQCGVYLRSFRCRLWRWRPSRRAAWEMLPSHSASTNSMYSRSWR